MPTMPRSSPLRPGGDIDQQALDWFVRELRGLAHDEQAALAAWLQADPAHQAALQRWRQDWQQLDRLPQPSLAQIRLNLARDKRLQARRAGLLAFGPRGPVIRRRQALAVAGAALGVSAAGLAVWQHLQRPVWQQQFASRRGQLLSMALPDGSRVQIDTLTRLDVRFLRHAREIHLAEGQAAFQVAADAARPLHIWAGDTRVTALGTRLSVRHTPGMPERPGVHVAVTEGRARVAARSRDGGAQTHEVVLAAGQQIHSDGTGHLQAAAPLHAPEAAAWRRQRVSLDDVSLAQAIAEFERYGDTRLRIASPAVAALRITGTFHAQDLANFRRTLPQVLPVRLVALADGWTEIAPRS